MSDLNVTFDKLNKACKEANEVWKKMMEENNPFDTIRNIAEDIVDRRDREIAFEFTKCICELLKKNGVTPMLDEYRHEAVKENSIECRYGVAITGLDFKEHDKRFKDEITQLKHNLEKTYNQLMEVEKEAQERIAELEKTRSDWVDNAIVWREKYEKSEKEIKELESKLEAKDNDSKRKDTEDYAKYNQITSGTYGLLFRKYKGKSRNDVILKFSEFINTLSENGIEVFDEAEGFIVEIKDDSLRSNDEIASLQKQIEKLESIRTRCHKSAMDSFDLGMYEFLHIVTADELKTTKDVNDRTVELPFDALETANMLINATYKWENCMTGKIYDKDIYDIDDLEQIAEHLLVYCKHHREDEE